MFCEHDWEAGRLLEMPYGKRELNRHYAKIESDEIKAQQDKIDKMFK